MAAVVLLLGLLIGGACSKESRTKIDAAGKSVATDLRRGSQQVEARLVAEAVRLDLKRGGLAEKQGLRSVAALRKAAVEVVSKSPGHPQVTEISDGDGDGRDDDGKVQVTVGKASACLLLPSTGTNTAVHDGAC